MINKGCSKLFMHDKEDKVISKLLRLIYYPVCVNFLVFILLFQCRHLESHACFPFILFGPLMFHWRSTISALPIKPASTSHAQTQQLIQCWSYFPQLMAWAFELMSFSQAFLHQNPTLIIAMKLQSMNKNLFR